MDDVEAAAGQAQLSGQIRSFMTWLGEPPAKALTTSAFISSP